MKDFTKLKTVCLVLVSLSLIGCGTFGTYNPATGRKEFVFISTSEEVSMGRDIHQKILQQYELSDDKGQLSQIERIGQHLTQVSDRQDYQYHFYLIEKDELNAFTTPGGTADRVAALSRTLLVDGLVWCASPIGCLQVGGKTVDKFIVGILEPDFAGLTDQVRLATCRPFRGCGTNSEPISITPRVTGAVGVAGVWLPLGVEWDDPHVKVQWHFVL